MWDSTWEAIVNHQSISAEMLDEEQMGQKSKLKANQIIWENQEVEIFYPTEQELKKSGLQK